MGAYELGLGAGVDFSGVMTVPLLALSPASALFLGFLIPAMPHVLVFKAWGWSCDERIRSPSLRCTGPAFYKTRRDLECCQPLKAESPRMGRASWPGGWASSIKSTVTQPIRHASPTVTATTTQPRRWRGWLLWSGCLETRSLLAEPTGQRPPACPDRVRFARQGRKSPRLRTRRQR